MKLTLVREIEPDRNKQRRAVYRCECGREKVIRMTYVNTGRTRSCGCSAQNAWRGNIRAQFAETKVRMK